MPPIIAQYRLTARDLLAFNLYHFHRSPLMLLILAGSVLPILWRFYAEIPATKGLGSVLGQFLFAAAVLALVAWLLLLFVVVLTLLTRLNSNILTDHVVTITESSVMEETPNSRIETNWAGIQKIRSNKKYLFLYIAAHLAHVIPRRAFENDASWQATFDCCILCKERSNKPLERTER
jgi:hypothetical protein